MAAWLVSGGGEDEAALNVLWLVCAVCVGFGLANRVCDRNGRVRGDDEGWRRWQIVDGILWVGVGVGIGFGVGVGF